MRTRLVLMIAALCLLVAHARADEAPEAEPAMGYHVFSLADLPEAGDLTYAQDWRQQERRSAWRPYAVVDGERGVGQARLAAGESWDRWQAELTEARVTVRAPRGAAVTGTVYVPNRELTGMRAIPFQIDADRLAPAADDAYHEVVEQHYRELWNRGYAGAAWFRHRAGLARAARGATDSPPEERDRRWMVEMGRDPLSQTYALYTGARAASENLQLDDVLRPRDEAAPAADVAVDELTGITIEPVDWAALTADLDPVDDPLARRIPSDQYAIFIRDLATARRLLAELEQYLLPMLEGTAPRAVSTGLAERYVRQMAMPLSELEGVAEAAGLRALAVTGSDPYWPSGTDVAIVFEVADAAPLLAVLRQGQEAAARAEGVERDEGETATGLAYTRVHDEPRRISGYVAQLDEQTVVLANSPVQVQRLHDVARGEQPALGELDEHTFMANRHRYRDGEATAVLLITDDAIRKWGSARWRIAASRRVRALAVMQEAQAHNLDFLVTGVLDPARDDFSANVPEMGDRTLTPAGIRTATYNTPDFLTPIAELEFDRVTAAEADAYRAWRDRYQNRWQVFDPIGLSLNIADERIAMDLTVLPLIRSSEYRDMVSLAGESTIGPEVGRPHDDAIAHFVMAIDMNTPQLRELRGMAQMMGLGADPLSWVGSTVSLYAGEDPLWEELLDAESFETAVEEHVNELPLAVEVAVKDRLRLTGFLVGLRGLVQQTAPDLTVWENFEHADQPYVRITAAVDELVGERDELTLYYLAREVLLVTLSEPLLHRALERRADREAAPADAGGDDAAADADEAGDAGDAADAGAGEGPAWLGEHMALRLRGPVFELLSRVERDAQLVAAQRAAWRYLPILNEWRHRYPDRDPLDVYEAFAGQRPRGPAGDTYVWDEQWQTMASTVYGHPGEPAEGPVAGEQLRLLRDASFGITFEHDGLRARTMLHRVPPELDAGPDQRE